ncbi:hypothetical protein L7F22_030334 [Adiantum nelumboides]|nr:hypothetical protein [Adiantum nelumboides]
MLVGHNLRAYPYFQEPTVSNVKTEVSGITNKLAYVELLTVVSYSFHHFAAWSDAEAAHHMSFEIGHGYIENAAGFEEETIFYLGIASPGGAEKSWSDHEAAKNVGHDIVPIESTVLGATSKEGVEAVLGGNTDAESVFLAEFVKRFKSNKRTATTTAPGEDVQHWCRSYHNCQVNGNKRLLYGPRQAVIANGPFEKWGMDAMGPLPRTANGKRYILVAIDSMTRWVEAQSIAKVNEKTVSKFVYTHICCRFGTPLEIVSDNGPGFRRGLLTKVCEVLKISHRHSTPYYPQSNGLVEKANGIIAGIIRKMVESKPKRWDNFLDGAIWAYITTYRDATQFTPFHLVYGQEALQPIELNIPTIKLTGRQEQNNDEAWIDRLLNLVELEWKREAAYHCYEKKALQLKDKLNEGIKDKQIKEKSFVLRYNNALDNRFHAKFERIWEGTFIVKKAFIGGYYQLMDLNGKEHQRKVNGYRLKPYLSRILPAVFETKQVSKKTKKVCCHCCSDTHQVKSCAFQHVLKEVAKNQKEKLSSPTSCPESSFQYDPVDGK